MIDRKMKELNNPSFARTIVNVASGNSNSTSSAASRDKGKARAKPPPMNLSPSTPLGSAIQTKGPLTPPPPYIQRHGASQGSATSSPTRSRGSSTVASVRTRPSNADLRSPPPGALSPDSAARRRSSAATVVPAASLPVSPGFQQQSPHLRVTRSVDEDDQNETEDTETTDADTEDELDNIDRSSRETGDSDWEQQRASPFTPSPSRMMARSASVQHSSPSALIQFLRDTEPPVTSNGSPSRSPPSSSRRPDLARSSSLDPTSRHPGPVSQDTEDGQRIPRRRSSRPTLMARPASRVENSTAQDIVKFLEGVSPPPPPPRRRPRENLSATDSQTQTTPATNNSVTTIFQNEDQGDLQQNRASSLPKLSPRPASFAGTSTDMRELAAFLREGPESSSPSRPPSASFAAARRAATSSPIPEEEFRPASRLSATSSDQPQSSSLQPTSRGRKRWSGMLENVLRGTSSPPISQMPHSSSAPSLIDEEQHEMSQSTPEQSTSAPPVPTSRPGLTRRGSTQKLRSPELGEDNSEELSSDGLPSVDPAAVSVPPTKTDKHPASSAAPLEYVKLARTKGTRLIKSIETQKRTFLAVLCGDSGERIELFTVRCLIFKENRC